MISEYARGVRGRRGRAGSRAKPFTVFAVMLLSSLSFSSMASTGAEWSLDLAEGENIVDMSPSGASYAVAIARGAEAVYVRFAQAGELGPFREVRFLPTTKGAVFLAREGAGWMLRTQKDAAGPFAEEGLFEDGLPKMEACASLDGRLLGYIFFSGQDAIVMDRGARLGPFQRAVDYYASDDGSLGMFMAAPAGGAFAKWMNGAPVAGGGIIYYAVEDAGGKLVGRIEWGDGTGSRDAFVIAGDKKWGPYKTITPRLWRLADAKLRWFADPGSGDCFYLDGAPTKLMSGYVHDERPSRDGRALTYVCGYGVIGGDCYYYVDGRLTEAVDVAEAADDGAPRRYSAKAADGYYIRGFRKSYGPFPELKLLGVQGAGDAALPVYTLSRGSGSSFAIGDATFAPRGKIWCNDPDTDLGVAPGPLPVYVAASAGKWAVYKGNAKLAPLAAPSIFSIAPDGSRFSVLDSRADGSYLVTEHGVFGPFDDLSGDMRGMDLGGAQPLTLRDAQGKAGDYLLHEGALHPCFIGRFIDWVAYWDAGRLRMFYDIE